MILDRRNNQLVIKDSPETGTLGFQRIKDYFEITSKSRATQEDADNLAKEPDVKWRTEKPANSRKPKPIINALLKRCCLYTYCTLTVH